MDIESMTGEEAVYALADVLALNGQKEMDAVQGYTRQLELIRKARSVFAQDTEVLAFLTELEEATNEKIADELSHARDLSAEYTRVTGIEPKED